MDTNDTLTLDVVDAYELDNLTVKLLSDNKAFKELMKGLKGYTRGTLELLTPENLLAISKFLEPYSYRSTIDELTYIARVAFIELG